MNKTLEIIHNQASLSTKLFGYANGAKTLEGVAGGRVCLESRLPRLSGQSNGWVSSTVTP
jgi:hypothetical protein